MSEPDENADMIDRLRRFEDAVRSDELVFVPLEVLPPELTGLLAEAAEPAHEPE